jgi:hypothetical protein
MSKKSRDAPFLQRYLNGEVLSDDIDDFIDAWHETSGKKELFAFLGMTKEEYALWLRDPDLLPHIARARQTRLPLASAVRSAFAELPIAARSADTPKVRRLKRWLEQQGIFIE